MVAWTHAIEGIPMTGRPMTGGWYLASAANGPRYSYRVETRKLGQREWRVRILHAHGRELDTYTGFASSAAAEEFVESHAEGGNA